MTRNDNDSQFHELLNVIPSPLLIFSCETQEIIQVNDEFIQLTGFDSSELAGKKLIESSLFIEPALMKERLSLFLETEKNDPVTLGIQKKDFITIMATVDFRILKNSTPHCCILNIKPLQVKYISNSQCAGSIDDSEFGAVFDTQVLQYLVNDLYKITGTAIAVVDLGGKVHVAAGWQEICTRFHRVNPETEKNCHESDVYLGSQSEKGHYSLYKCKNHMWDMASPIIVGGRRMANLYLGQFFFDDEAPDVDLFIAQAEKYGFDKVKYLDALEKVPRFNRTFIENLMAFYARLATLLGEMGLSRKNLEQKNVELSMSEEKYRSIFENGMEGIFQTSLDGKIINANPAMARILGYESPDDLIKSVNDIKNDLYVNPQDRDRFISELFEKKKMRSYEVKLKRKNGESRWVSIAARIVTGVPVQIEGFINDITDRKNLEEQLVHSQKLEGIGLLAGGIAHDFNNILTPILGYTEILLSMFAEDDQGVSEYLKLIYQSSLRARELTDQLLTFGRKHMIECKNLDIGEVITTFKKILRSTIREDIDLNLYISDPLNLVNADSGQIEQILMNLTINAKDAMPKGGKITIEADNTVIGETNTYNIADIPYGDYVMVSISDTGTGMSPQVLNQIFEPFFTTKERGKGTGLGLSTVYGIVKQHKAHITVSSEKGKGTVFRIFFPAVVCRDNEKSEERDENNQKIATGKETILVVEDDENVRKLATRMLEKLGYNVIVADGPKKAVSVARDNQERINLLLTDVIMPEMDGYALYNTLKRSLPGLNVLFMSGYAHDILGESNIGNEGAHLLQKPFSFKALSEKVREVIDS